MTQHKTGGPAFPRHTTDAEIGDAMTKQVALHRASKGGTKPDARQEGWCAGIEAVAKVVRDCIYHDSAGTGFDEDKFDAAIRAARQKGARDE